MTRQFGGSGQSGFRDKPMKVAKPETSSNDEDRAAPSPRPISELDTRTRLLQVATRRFAEHGIDGVSTRDITRGANANSAAIGYHFGSKENLVRAVFESLAGPVNRTRLNALTTYERAVGPDGPLEVEKVARCLIEPTLRAASDPTHDAHYLARLVLLARPLTAPWIMNLLAEQYDEIFGRFVAALKRALPDESYETIAWRYDFLVGSLLHAATYFDGTGRLSRVTNGRCNTKDVDAVVQQLIQFAGGAMKQAARESPRKARQSRASYRRPAA
jgi:AcrR family transcriptional regulator